MSWLAVIRWSTGVGEGARTIPFETRELAEDYAARHRAVGIDCTVEEYKPALQPVLEKGEGEG